MPDYLTELPVELIHQILDYVSIFDILSSLCLTNKRLRLNCLTYPYYQLDFNHNIKKKYQFDLICSKVPYLTSQIISLKISDQNDLNTTNKILLFFSRFKTFTNTFLNLHSIQLSNINRSTWQSIKNPLTSFLHLISLSIEFIDDDETFDKVFSSLLFFSSSLKYLTLTSSCEPIEISDKYVSIQTKQSSIEYFNLNGIKTDLMILLKVLPYLRSLNVILDYEPLFKNSLFLLPFNLEKLSIKVTYICFSVIKRLISPMNRLTYLTIDADDADNDMADGFIWGELLKNVSVFKFKFAFTEKSFNKKKEKINLDSFSTSFWLEEKKWTVTYDHAEDTNYSVLYSNPYFLDIYPHYYTRGMIKTISTSSKQVTFPSVHELMVDIFHQIQNIYLSRYSHVEYLNLFINGLDFEIMFKRIMQRVNTSKITTFKTNTCCEHANLLQLLRNLPCLRILTVHLTILKKLLGYPWSNITHLTISRNFTFCAHCYGKKKVLKKREIDVFCHGFNKLVQLVVCYSDISDLARLINGLKKTLANIEINEIGIGASSQIITRKWFKKNINIDNIEFSYSPKNNVSRFWI